MGRKMNEEGRAYAKEAANLALSTLIIKQCRHCSHPVIDGYCCGHCGSSSPNTRDQEPSFIEI